MATDMYIVFEPDPASGMLTVEGETTDDWFKNGGQGGKGSGGQGKGAFELLDWSFDVNCKSSIGSYAGGAGVGKAEFGDFTVSRNVDKSSPAFFRNCVAGAHYKTVTLSCRKAGPEKDKAGKPYLVYTFGTVFTTKVAWKNSDAGPSEDITFCYGELKIDYFPQKKDGTLDTGNVKEQGWSVLTNTANTTV